MLSARTVRFSLWSPSLEEIKLVIVCLPPGEWTWRGACVFVYVSAILWAAAQPPQASASHVGFAKHRGHDLGRPRARDDEWWCADRASLPGARPWVG